MGNFILREHQLNIQVTSLDTMLPGFRRPTHIMCIAVETDNYRLDDMEKFSHTCRTEVQ